MKKSNVLQGDLLAPAPVKPARVLKAKEPVTHAAIVQRPASIRAVAPGPSLDTAEGRAQAVAAVIVELKRLGGRLAGIRLRESNPDRVECIEQAEADFLNALYALDFDAL